jgi:hypothetical protein
MEQENNSIRERLLLRLPQPENLTAYREEIASTLAKHDKSLFWDKWGNIVILLCAFGVMIWASSDWARKQGVAHQLEMGAGILYFVGLIDNVKYFINRSKVDLLKEMKQVQLQILELQASLQKKGER